MGRAEARSDVRLPRGGRDSRTTRTTEPGSRDDLRDTGYHLAPDASHFLGSPPESGAVAPKTKRKTGMSSERSRSASTGRTGWRRGQSRANPSRDDFGQMPADCCVHACAPEHTDEPGRRDGSRTYVPRCVSMKATITSVGGRAPPGRKTPRPSAKAHWRGGVPGPTGSSRSARWCRLLRRPTTSRRRACPRLRSRGRADADWFGNISETKGRPVRHSDSRARSGGKSRTRRVSGCSRLRIEKRSIGSGLKGWVCMAGERPTPG